MKWNINKKRMSLAILLLLIFMMPVAAQFNPSPIVIALAPPEAGARFGAALAISDVNGDGIPDIIVGVPFATVGNQVEAGKVLIYFGGTPFAMRMKPDVTLQAPTPQAGARFGVSIAIGDFNGGGADIAVGADLADVTMGTMPMQTVVKAAGQAYVFFGPTFTMTATLQAATPQAGARFGTSVASADLNNDMFDDVEVGGDRTNVAAMNATQFNAGEVLVFFGSMMFSSSSTTPLAPSITLHGATIQSGAAFGRVMVAGDVDGDGIKDVVISAPLFNLSNSLRNVGEAYVFQGAAGIMGTPAANATIRGQISNSAFFGTSLLDIFRRLRTMKESAAIKRRMFKIAAMLLFSFGLSVSIAISNQADVAANSLQ